MGKKEFYCDLCELQFHFKSKYERHLMSASHKRFAECLEMEARVETARMETASPSTCEDQFYMSEGESHAERESGCSVVEVIIESDEEGSDLDSDDVLSILNAQQKGDFYPFESQLHALLFMLVNGPRPMGEENLKFVLYVMKGLDPFTPSLSTIKKLKLPGYIEPSKHYTTNGIPFYLSYPSDIIKRCLGVLEVASSICRFPEVPKKEMREMFHGERWMTDERFYSPMINHDSAGHIFIGDFVNYATSFGPKLAKVKQFFKKEGDNRVFIRIVLLHLKAVDAYIVNGEEVITDNLVLSLSAAPPCLFKACDNTFMSEQEYEDFIAPHPLKQFACGMQVIMLPLILYTDDTSGNRSKQWNKFDCWCLKIAGLSTKENSNLHNIHFICCSNKCGVIDMTQPLVDDLIKLESEGIVAYDALLKENVLVVAPVICLIGDNPRQSEIMNHAGTTAKMFCRICMAERGICGSDLSAPRTKVQTLDAISEVESKTTEKKKAEEKTKHGVTTVPNCLLKLPVDFHRSTPVETLHTILLGPYKYFLRLLIPRLTTNEKAKIQAILSSFNFSGFNLKLGNKILDLLLAEILKH